MTQPMAMRLDELVSGVRADLAVKVFGGDAAENRRIAEQVAGIVGRVPGASEVQVEATEGQSYLEVQLHRDAMARYGIPMVDAQQALQSAVSRTPVSRVVDGNYALNVVVQYPAELRTSPEALGSIAVPATNGSRIPLATIADIRLESGPVLVRRERGQRLVVVQSNVRGRDLGGFVPVALSHGMGAEVQRPLATVVIGGLITSTLLTLLVLPTLYAWVEGRKDRRAEEARAQAFGAGVAPGTAAD